jgi:hypothetical protein
MFFLFSFYMIKITTGMEENNHTLTYYRRGDNRFHTRYCTLSNSARGYCTSANSDNSHPKDRLTEIDFARTANEKKTLARFLANEELVNEFLLERKQEEAPQLDLLKDLSTDEATQQSAMAMLEFIRRRENKNRTEPVASKKEALRKAVASKKEALRKAEAAKKEAAEALRKAEAAKKEAAKKEAAEALRKAEAAKKEAAKKEAAKKEAAEALRKAEAAKKEAAKKEAAKKEAEKKKNSPSLMNINSLDQQLNSIHEKLFILAEDMHTVSHYITELRNLQLSTPESEDSLQIDPKPEFLKKRSKIYANYLKQMNMNFRDLIAVAAIQEPSKLIETLDESNFITLQRQALSDFETELKMVPLEIN